MYEKDYRVKGYPTAPIDTPDYGDTYFDKSSCELMIYDAKRWKPLDGLASDIFKNMRFTRSGANSFKFPGSSYIFLIDFKLEDAGIENFKRIMNREARYTKADSEHWEYIFDNPVDLTMFLMFFGEYIHGTYEKPETAVLSNNKVKRNARRYVKK